MLSLGSAAGSPPPLSRERLGSIDVCPTSEEVLGEFVRELVREFGEGRSW